MLRVKDRVEYVLYAPTHMKSHSQKVYADLPKTQPVPGVIRMERYPLGNGKYLSRGDAHGMFTKNAEALRREYSRSELQSFSNVETDGVKIKSRSDAMAETRQNFLKAMRDFGDGCEFFAYCGHGSGQSLPSAGIDRHDGYREFVKELKRILVPEPTIIFYACSTGIENGFAHSIAREIPKARVFAHTTAARGDNNPDTVVIQGDKWMSFEDWLGEENFQLWHGKVLDKHHNKLYLQYPWMSKETLLNAIGATTQARAA
jgi:hypothetical protein